MWFSQNFADQNFISINKKNDTLCDITYSLSFVAVTCFFIYLHSILYPKLRSKLSNKFVHNGVFSDLRAHAYFVSSESRVLRLIPCCSYYWPLLRHYDVNDCLSAIRSINWIQRNVIHYSLQPSRCWGFCKSNSFIMLISLFCHMHHFHLSGVEKSSDGFGSLNKRCLTFNEMRNMKNRFQWQVAYDNHNKKAIWMNTRLQFNCGTMLCFCLV